MKRVGIIPNFTKDKNLDLTKKIIQWIEQHDGEVLLQKIDAEKIHRKDLAYKADEIYAYADFIIVLGGDGTLLGVSRRVGKNETPILGVNLGHLGFLTEVEIGDIYQALENIMADHYALEKRMMLEVAVFNNNKLVKTFFALNDVVITKGAFARIINLKTFIDNNYLDTYPADGLIISSPTGSTAYSLSAGGPIVDPKNSLLIITPICPHRLNARSVIISDREKIRVEIEDRKNDILLTIDGQEGYKLQDEDDIVVKKAEFSANFIRVNHRTFYDVLRNKLAERTVLHKDNV
ncbi:NAD(+)/NADH kinase [Irregularibacter muris]|uniref:NAD kinase n=1 Tax=Irregularibacter muris TaxID=1796619 RepID=A0AAE3L261_9FIRM|nr:NAD(+)/NADH kinase [Irregularibacter muris]MCR1898004.1 NAD(+)/NADH kinase [Irregularibacter muris]